jgi:hypothetical protein
VTVNPALLDEESRTGLPAGVYLVDDAEGQTVIPPDRVELFRAEGKIFTIPKMVDPGIAFRYLRAIRKNRDSEAAMADMLYDVLGEAVMDALADTKLTPDQFTQVMKAVNKHTMGAIQKALGN